ncbi:phosphatidate cytidylyltransferase [Yoonia sp. I 8.24]|uniref:phosphatidate cytidylyltransferase n=1 Tax=Yoonia sp. I 8.24 TaxID=1537229 RepID=UPI001EE0846E|nr:phosphatidate cytidylyltransferase [Yoonia sp. I 8.24]MCG3266239.1 phosphatidate cytidylyltransferase [Yoonia sp. I 8.24]
MASNWDDLKPRVLSAIAMTIVGAASVVMGGIWFQMLVIFVTAVMVWELWTMIHDEPTKGMLLAALSAAVLSGAVTDNSMIGLLLLAVVPLIGATQLPKERGTFFIYAYAILGAGWGLVQFRMGNGVSWVVWMLLVVVVTDISGYFAGRMLGGPKFWPKISPKKTWSGTIAGWVGAGFVGFVFSMFTDAGLSIIAISVAVSFAGQMGDIAQSAVKRRMGVKDSSDLIPGHGGLFDRFDAVLGATLFLLLFTFVSYAVGGAS